MRSTLTSTYSLTVILAAAACGGTDAAPEADASGTTADASAADAAMQVADAASPDAAGTVFPNGEPDNASLYFRATCTQGGCDTYSVFDQWHVGQLVTCDYDGTTVSLRTAAIPDGAYSFSLSFVPDGRNFALAPATTAADWSLPDGASAFLWFGDETPLSSGTVSLDRCGTELSGAFSLKNLCEYHGCAFGDLWTTDLEGAFRCQPTLPVSCD